MSYLGGLCSENFFSIFSGLGSFLSIYFFPHTVLAVVEIHIPFHKKLHDLEQVSLSNGRYFNMRSVQSHVDLHYVSKKYK